MLRHRTILEADKSKLTAKVEKRRDNLEIVYSDERWKQLCRLRESSKLLLKTLKIAQIDAVVHGSVARGDVRHGSDIDAFISHPPSSFQIENALEQAKFRATRRVLIQATPLYAMKAYIEVGDSTTVSFPLMNLRRVERELYKYSGEVDLDQLGSDVRVTGVDKRLMLIEPIAKGHVESSVLGRETQVAKKLGVALETVVDRVHALTKRDEVGRTGIFLTHELSPDETFEMALNRIAEKNPAVRRRLSAKY